MAQRRSDSASNSHNIVPFSIRRNTGHQITALIVLIVVLSLAAAGAIQLGQTRSQSGAAVAAAEAPGAGGEFDYFPRQYQNQASESTEHIQAY